MMEKGILTDVSYKFSMDACTDHDTKSILLLIPSIGQKWTCELWLMNIKPSTVPHDDDALFYNKCL